MNAEELRKLSQLSKDLRLAFDTVEREYIELQKQFSKFLHGTLDFQHKNSASLLKLVLAADQEKLAELFKDGS